MCARCRCVRDSRHSRGDAPGHTGRGRHREKGRNASWEPASKRVCGHGVSARKLLDHVLARRLGSAVADPRADASRCGGGFRECDPGALRRSACCWIPAQDSSATRPPNSPSDEGPSPAKFFPESLATLGSTSVQEVDGAFPPIIRRML